MAYTIKDLKTRAAELQKEIDEIGLEDKKSKYEALSKRDDDIAKGFVHQDPATLHVKGEANNAYLAYRRAFDECMPLKRELSWLNAAINSDATVKQATKQTEAAMVALDAAMEQREKAERTSSNLAAMLEAERDKLRMANEAAGAAALEAVKAGFDLSNVAKPDQSGVAVAEAALQQAGAELQQAVEVESAAKSAHQEAEQAALEARADATTLPLLLASMEYQAALAAHHVAYRNAYRVQFNPDDVNAHAWDAAKAVIYGDD